MKLIITCHLLLPRASTATPSWGMDPRRRTSPWSWCGAAAGHALQTGRRGWGRTLGCAGLRWAWASPGSMRHRQVHSLLMPGQGASVLRGAAAGRRPCPAAGNAKRRADSCGLCYASCQLPGTRLRGSVLSSSSCASPSPPCRPTTVALTASASTAPPASCLARA